MTKTFTVLLSLVLTVSLSAQEVPSGHTVQDGVAETDPTPDDDVLENDWCPGVRYYSTNGGAMGFVPIGEWALWYMLAGNSVNGLDTVCSIENAEWEFEPTYYHNGPWLLPCPPHTPGGAPGPWTPITVSSVTGSGVSFDIVVLDCDELGPCDYLTIPQGPLQFFCAWDIEEPLVTPGLVEMDAVTLVGFLLAQGRLMDQGIEVDIVGWYFDAIDGGPENVMFPPWRYWRPLGDGRWGVAAGNG